MNPTAPVTLSLSSDPLYLSGVREFLQAVASRMGFSHRACGQIALASDEAICNVIRHGYDKRTDGPIWVHLWPTTPQGEPGLTIVIEDEARQVDPAQIKSRNLEDIRPGGLGVHIIREVMDQAVWQPRADRPVGMRLTMVKLKSSDRPDESCGGNSCATPPPHSRPASTLRGANTTCNTSHPPQSAPNRRTP